MLSVELLGPPQLRLEGQPLKVTRRKSRAVLYYLAAQPAPLTREHLINLFWPDHARRPAQQILRTTVHGLHQVLGDSLFVEDDWLGLAEATVVDARQFATRLALPIADAPLLAATLELYRGDFLEDFTLPDSAAFEEWATLERERYRRLAVRGYAALAQQYEDAQDFAAAIETLARALAFDPFQEDLQRAAMRLHYLAGDRAAAIRRYEQLRRLLDDELGVPPLEETRDLYQAIVTGSLPAPVRLPPPAASPPGTASQQPTASDMLPFVGREAELRTLERRQDQLVLVEGEPGIGKTRLLAEFLDRSKALVLSGAARELERGLPYQPLIEALRGLLRRPEWPGLRADLDLPLVWRVEIARLLPELGVDLPGRDLDARPADESRLWEGAHQFLLALARQTPIILFLDDLQWADRSTLALLGYLLRQSVAAPIRFVAAARPVDARSALADLLQALTREGRVVRLFLERLAAAETAALARRLSPADSAALAGWLDRSAEGNPYILAELVRYAHDNAILAADGRVDHAALDAAPVVPDPVYSLIQSRLARLPDDARRLVDTAVAAGRDFDFEIVGRAAGLSEPATLDAIDELRAARLIRPLDGTRYTFDHSLTREVAYREGAEPRHRAAHRHIAEAIEQLRRNDLDPVAGLIASHFTEGGDPERAAPYAYRAGDLAAAVAGWNEAVTFYEQALPGSGPGTRREILMKLGEARWHTGALAEASESFQAALALAEATLPTPSREADAARLAIARTFMIRGRYAEALPLARQVRAAGHPGSAVESELVSGVILSVEGADLCGAVAHLEAAEVLLSRQGPEADPALLAAVRFEQGSVAAQQGDLAQAVAHYRVALAVADNLGSDVARPWSVLARNNLAYHLLLLGDPDAIRYAEEGLRLAEERGSLEAQPYLFSTLGEIALAAGDLEAAERHFSQGLALAERLSIRERVAGITANLGLVALRRGETARAMQLLSTALAQADALGTQHLAAQIRLWLVPLLPGEEARVRLAEARAIAERGGRGRLLDEVARLERHSASA